MVKVEQQKILLAHGSGGLLYHQLIEEVFLPVYGSHELSKLNDAAVLESDGKNLAFTTDSFVVRPRFFPGGDIGRLSVCGTVNDLAMSGARPCWLSVGMIIETGFAISELRQIAASIAAAAEEANIAVVTGDTKVVEKGACDGIYINTAGVGIFERGTYTPSGNLVEGDKIIISGNIGDHGMAVMAAREQLGFEPPISSDVAPLAQLARALMDAAPHLKWMRDPTRGGVAGVLNEWAATAVVNICIDEASLPVADNVNHACELLGLDPLYVANEGKLLAAVPADEASAALRALHDQLLGANAAVIGEVTSGKDGRVYLQTSFGGTRIVDQLNGEQLPRIC